MLIEFTVGNFRSIDEKQTLSMVASKLAGLEGALAPLKAGSEEKVLRCAALYGANASGKSNVWRAVKSFVFLATQSATRLQEGDALDVEPFLLREGSEGEPTYFEAVLRVGARTVRYGFEATRERVESEWLFAAASSRETRLFTRVGSEIDVNERAFREGKGKESLARANALFLPVVAQWNGSQSREVMRAIGSIHTVSGLKSPHLFASYTMQCLSEGKGEDHPHRERILHFLRDLDVALGNVRLKPLEEPEPVAEEPDTASVSAQASDEAGTEASAGDGARLRAKRPKPVRVEMMQPVFGEEGQVSERALSLMEHGSEGTIKLFSFAGPIIDTLSRGAVLFVDELDSRLHPLVTRAIVQLFNSPETNPCNAQLIFNTHDTNLLSPRLLRRDQIWFTEKNSRGATRLYSLAEFRTDEGKRPRPEEPFDESYVRGRYGAVPFLGDFRALFEEAARESECAEENCAPSSTSSSTSSEEEAAQGVREEAVVSGG